MSFWRWVDRFLSSRGVKFLLGGAAAALFNLALMSLLIEGLGLSTPLMRNIANVLAIELSLCFSFVIYRSWVWRSEGWLLRDVLLRQLPLYHVSAGAAILLRVFAVFPILDWMGVSYGVNTLIGALLGAVINYAISDRVVFKDSPRQDNNSKLAGTTYSPTSNQSNYYPEVFSPAVASASARHDLSLSSTPSSANPLVSTKVSLVSLVMPAYNEEECIEPTVHRISEVLDASEVPYEILVINDNSRDRTEAILQRLTTENPRLRYLNSYYPNGFGFAVRCGLENFRGDAVAVVMADNSDDPYDIITYYQQLAMGYDCVFGSRFIPGGQVVDYPHHKLFVNRLANLFVKTLFGMRFNDTTNAFKMYRREVIQGISPLISHHFNLTVELPLKAVVRGYSHSIVPITWRNRAAGVSKLKLKEMGSRYLFIVLYLWLEKHLSRGDYHRNQSIRALPQSVKESSHV